MPKWEITKHVTNRYTRVVEAESIEDAWDTISAEDRHSCDGWEKDNRPSNTHISTTQRSEEVSWAIFDVPLDKP